MSTQVQRRRGTNAQNKVFTGALGEVTVDTDNNTLIVHDGATQGGFPLLREDFANNLDPSVDTITLSEYAQFDTGYSATGNEAQGSLYWNVDERTLSLVSNGATIEMGQKLELEGRNNTGSTIAKGTPVYASGTIGNSGRITVAPMIADGTIEAKYTVGVTDEAIANGEDGKVIKVGKIRKINTNAYNEGDVLYVSPTSAGGWTTTKPDYPDLSLPIAFVVTKSATVGEIYTRVEAIDENTFQPRVGNTINPVVELTALTNDADDYAIGDGTFFSVSLGAFYGGNDITGFAGGVDGREIEVINRGTDAMDVQHQNTASTDTNRIISPTGADIVLNQYDTVRLRYYAGSINRWIIVGGTY